MIREGNNKSIIALNKKKKAITHMAAIIELNNNLWELNLWYLYLKRTKLTTKKYPAANGNKNKLYGMSFYIFYFTER